MAKGKQLTIKDVNAKVDKLADSFIEFAKEIKTHLGLEVPTEPEKKYPVLSEITEVGTIVELNGEDKIRLLDTNYEGTGKKLWQFVNVLKGDEVSLGLPENKNDGGYPTAENLRKVLDEIFDTLPKWLSDQIVEVPVDCYIPKDKVHIKQNELLFVLSATEMCQNRPYLAKEGRPLEYYIKNTPEFNNWHWLRTPYVLDSYHWGFVSYAGNVSYINTGYNYGVAPAFCTD